MRIKITDDEITLLGAYIKEKSGIVLDQSKGYLFETRLSSLLIELELTTYRQLYNAVRKDVTNMLLTRMLDAVCTNETSFFRDKAPFMLLVQKLVPDFYENNRNRTLKIWSAASSTGQEVYSMIMQLFDAGIMNTAFPMKFLATDISDAAISKGSRGVYSDFELSRGINQSKLPKYFNAHGDEWKIKDEIRALVQFKKANLLDSASIKRFGTFDIIFCRNVAIYFSREDKETLFNTLTSMLNPGGVLIIGSTESMMGITTPLKRRDFRGIIYYDLSS